VPLALVAGLRVNYTQAGSGPPLMLLHGWGNNSLMLQPLAAQLADLRTVMVPDLPGFGRTEAPKPLEGWDTRAHAAFIVGLMDKLGWARADLFGHSHGGRIATYVAATSPERVGRLILCGSAGLRPHLTLKSRLRRWQRRLLLKAAHRAARYGLLGRQGAERARRLSERFASADYRAAGVMRPTMARLLAEDMEGMLPRIQAPALLIWGEMDRETPLELGQRSSRLIPHASLDIIAGAGHHVFIEQPEPVVRAIRAFLQQDGDAA
jgi:pimeloyl-ACP methyl ester carboxylesterase